MSRSAIARSTWTSPGEETKTVIVFIIVNLGSRA
jgi:hypothetical protein